MAKKIWIINPQTGSPVKMANPRYVVLAKYFMQAGYDVTTFNSSQREGIEIPNGKYVEKQYGEYKFVHVKVSNFKGNGIKRMLSIYRFARNVCKISKLFEKPDIILQNIHPPFDYPIVGLAKRLNAKYIAEAWDLWPADFVTFGLIGAKNPLLKVAYAVEKQYYYHADEIIFTFAGGSDYIRMKGWTIETGGKVDLRHVHYINNGIDLEQFDVNCYKYQRPDEDMNRKDIHKIVYLGSIRKANNVKMLIDAARILQSDSKYQFFIYGNGNYREELIRYVKENEINNVTFKEKRIPLEECAWVVSQATVNVMNYEKNFGWMGVSSGKLWQYLAAGRPIVCNISIAYDDIITNNNLGVARDIGSPEEYAEKIRTLAEQPAEEYDAMCERVRRTADDFDYKRLAAREIEVIESL